MLEPDGRELVFDALRPPTGYRLDTAVGTSYSLDLQALLLSPLAFALFDWATDEDGEPNALALLEAVRRHAERITVFCQAGHVALPKQYRALLVYLEPSVVEVLPPDPQAIFHPKLWLLKFAAAGEQDRFRLLCLTRNLTFSHSWDTLLTLEGTRATPAQLRATRDRNRPLQRFVEVLPSLAVRPLASDLRDRVTRLADELLNVTFAPPDGFQTVGYHPLGIGESSPPLSTGADRVLAVSPFLGPGTLAGLTAQGHGHVLVSRAEALDRVGAKGLSRFTEKYVLTPSSWQELAAEDDEVQPLSAGASVDEAVAEAAESPLTGLHAKLYVVEHGRDVHVYTGSANATDAAFSGNVEFLVELVSQRSQVSLEKLLAAENGATSFRDLLEPYTPNADEPSPESPQERLQRVLERARRAIGGFHFTARLDGREEGFSLRLDGQAERPIAIKALGPLRCWPASLGAGHSAAAELRGSSLHASFGRISRESVTSFFAFELTAREGSLAETVRFVVNAELLGAPKDRRESVLVDLLRSRSDVLRYLLFLLARDDVDMQGLVDMVTADPDHTGSAPDRHIFGQVPLFEQLVRTLATDPSRLDDLARLLDDLRRAGLAEELLPERLDEVWGPVWQARQELRT